MKAKISLDVPLSVLSTNFGRQIQSHNLILKYCGQLDPSPQGQLQQRLLIVFKAQKHQIVIFFVPENIRPFITIKSYYFFRFLGRTFKFVHIPIDSHLIDSLLISQLWKSKLVGVFVEYSRSDLEFQNR